MSNINTIDQFQPDSDNPASTGTTDLAAFDAYSRAVMGAVDKVGPAVLHLQIEAQKGPGGSGSGVVTSRYAAAGRPLPSAISSAD